MFPELTPHRFRTHFVQNLSRRHTVTAFSNGISCSTPPCVRFGLYQKILNNGHALLAVRPTTNPACTCRDAFVLVACLSLNGEESGTVIGDPESSSGLFQSPLKIRKIDRECYAEDPKLSLDESSSLRSFLGLKRTEILSARRVEERSGLRWGLTPICCPPPDNSTCSRCSLVTCQSSVKHLSTSQGDSQTDSFLCLVGSDTATATLAQALAVAQVLLHSELPLPPLYHEGFHFKTHRRRSCTFGHRRHSYTC